MGGGGEDEAYNFYFIDSASIIMPSGGYTVVTARMTPRFTPQPYNLTGLVRKRRQSRHRRSFFIPMGMLGISRHLLGISRPALRNLRISENKGRESSDYSVRKGTRLNSLYANHRSKAVGASRRNFFCQLYKNKSFSKIITERCTCFESRYIFDHRCTLGVTLNCVFVQK